MNSKNWTALKQNELGGEKVPQRCSGSKSWYKDFHVFELMNQIVCVKENFRVKLPQSRLPFIVTWNIGGAWWAAVYGVTQSQTRLKWLSSSSNIFLISKLQSHIKLVKLKSLRMRPRYWYHLKSPKMILICSLCWEPLKCGLTGYYNGLIYSE